MTHYVAGAGGPFIDPGLIPIRWCPSWDPGTLGGLMINFESSYMLNPHWSFSQYKQPTGGPPTFYATWFRRISDYPRQLALGCELMYGLGTNNDIPHPGPGNITYWNLLFVDGHVGTVQDGLLMGVANGRASGIGNGLNVIVRFDDCLDILETEADGRNPNNGMHSSMALPGYYASDMANPYQLREVNYPNQKLSNNMYTGPVNWP
jgi:hypothetical protein